MPESNHRVAILVALIGVVGTLGAALIGSWDRIFRSASDPSQKIAPPQSNQTAIVPAGQPIINIAGIWIDRDYPSIRSQIIQDGNSFHFTRSGILPNGAEFNSSGNGTVNGLHITSNYSTRYQAGPPSAGECSGTVSANGTGMDLICRDSLLGMFSIVADRH